MISSTLHPTITAITRAEWDRLLGHEAEGYDYYLALEHARLPGFEFAYACVFANGRLALIAPLFWGDLDLAIGAEGFGAKAVTIGRRFHPRLMIQRTLFVGSPFGEHATIGLAPDAGAPGPLLCELVAALGRVCRERRLAFVLFKDLRAADATTLGPELARLGFTRGESFPNVVVPLPYQRMEDYLAGLSHATRKDLRRKLRAAHTAATLTVEVLDQVEDRLEPVYALYAKTYEAGTVRFEKLTPEYFLEVGRRQRGSAKFFLFYADARLVCFNLCFLHDGVLIDKFIGLDYSVSRRLNLYFYTWHHNIDWCIRAGIRAYQVGQTDYGEKLRLGGQPVPLFFFARHENPIFNRALRAAAPWLAPATSTPR